MNITGSCHCGNISFSFLWPDEAAEIPARACDCTFCVKHGGVWTSHPRGTLRVSISDPGALGRYTFGTGTASFLVCASCGVVPLVISQIEGKTYAVVSVNAFDNVDRSRLRIRPATFQEEDAKTRLERRRCHWIPEVILTEGRS